MEVRGRLSLYTTLVHLKILSASRVPTAWHVVTLTQSCSSFEFLFNTVLFTALAAPFAPCYCKLETLVIIYFDYVVDLFSFHNKVIVLFYETATGVRGLK